MLDDTKNEPSKYRTRNWAEINNELLAAFSANSDIKFIKLRWLGQVYLIIDACIHRKGIITVQNTAGAGAVVFRSNFNSK